ncbi:MAG: CZB domain-containing protein [Aquificaceae bacterium]|nr:CZB domain-containing protein [Aquificaceae bacterium]
MSLIDTDFYLAQHEVYIKRLKSAIEKRQDFNHKECCKNIKENCCAFGQAFYQDIMPRLYEFPENIKEVILQIEDVHCTFHEIGKRIDTKNPDEELLREMQNTSLTLYQLFMKLKRLINEQNYSRA